MYVHALMGRAAYIYCAFKFNVSSSAHNCWCVVGGNAIWQQFEYYYYCACSISISGELQCILFIAEDIHSIVKELQLLSASLLEMRTKT